VTTLTETDRGFKFIEPALEGEITGLKPVAIFATLTIIEDKLWYPTKIG